MRTTFTPMVFRVLILSEIGMLSLRSTSSSTTSTGNSGWIVSSGHVGTAATMSMSDAAFLIHSVSAPSNILWSSTIASLMRFISVTGFPLVLVCWVLRWCYWSAGLSTRQEMSTRRLEF